MKRRTVTTFEYDDQDIKLEFNPIDTPEVLEIAIENEPDLNQYKSDAEDLAVLQALRSIAEPKSVVVDNFYADSYDGGTAECTLPDGTKDNIGYQEVFLPTWGSPSRHYIVFLEETADVPAWEDIAKEICKAEQASGQIVAETTSAIVVGYLVHDEDCGNPLEEKRPDCCCRSLRSRRSLRVDGRVVEGEFRPARIRAASACRLVRR
jgi:hypothetical protein